MNLPLLRLRHSLLRKKLLMQCRAMLETPEFNQAIDAWQAKESPLGRNVTALREAMRLVTLQVTPYDPDFKQLRDGPWLQGYVYGYYAAATAKLDLLRESRSLITVALMLSLLDLTNDFGNVASIVKADMEMLAHINEPTFKRGGATGMADYQRFVKTGEQPSAAMDVLIAAREGSTIS